MSGNAVRLQAIKNVEAYVPPAVSFDRRRGARRDLRRERLQQGRDAEAAAEAGLQVGAWRPSSIGAKLDPPVADAVASAMKDWAIEKGATHYAHVFYPLTGLTAEKHDSFLAPDGDGRRSPSSPARR